MRPTEYTCVQCALRLTWTHGDRGQGLQHAIADASNYVDALLKIGGSQDGALRQEVIKAYDDDMIGRGAKAVKLSLQEAENSLDLETVGKMLMVKYGHGRV